MKRRHEGYFLQIKQNSMATAAVSGFLKSPFKNFFVLWLPVLFSILAEPLTGLVDTAFIAKLGAEQLAALGVGTMVLTAGLWCFNFLSVGSQTEVSQASGKNDLNHGKRIGSLAIFLGAIIGTALAIIAILFASELAQLMGADGQILENSVNYITIRAYGGPAVLVTMTCFGIFYGLADMRSPLLIAATVNGLNILLDWLLIFGVGPFPVLGISGAALASVISQWIGVIWCCTLIYKKIGFTLQIDFADMKKLMGIGRDMVIRTGSLLLFLLLATRVATRLGADSGAAHQAIRQVWVFSSLFLDGAAITAQSVVGYYFGSGQIVNVKKIAKFVTLWSLGIGIFLMCLMLYATTEIASLLVPTSSLLLFLSAWKISAFMQPLSALAFVTDGIHWGTGDFRFLRNVVLFATCFSCAALLVTTASGQINLTYIWIVTGGWIFIRAVLGILRIWPGIGSGPFNTPTKIQDSSLE